MKKCPYCGRELEDNDKYCFSCGREVLETVEPTVVSENYDGDTFAKEQVLLRDRYSKRASNAFTLSIVSIVLCCCSITAIISLIFSITLLLDMKKLSEETKNSAEYKKIKNKSIISIVLAGFVVVIWFISFVEGLINPIDYEELYNSIYGELANSVNG